MPQSNLAMNSAKSGAGGISPALLAWAERMYGDALDQACVVDGEYRLCYANPALEQLCGMGRATLRASDVRDVFPLFRRESWAQPLSEALGGNYVSSPRCFIDPTGAGESVSTFYTPLFDGGEPVGCVIVRKDTHMAGATLAHVRETENRFRTMANCSPVLLWMSGTDSLCSFFNQTWLEFTGRTMEEELGVKWAEGVHPEDFQTCMDTYMRSFNGRAAFRMTYRLRRHDGEYRWILDTGVPRFAPGGAFEGYIGSCVDITERIRAEQALHEAVERLNRSNVELERFAYVASHDLQEPLLKVLSFCDLLRSEHGEQLDEDARDCLGRIQGAARRMRSLISDLLDYSRARVGERLRQHVQLEEVLNEVIHDLEARIRQTGAVLHVSKLPAIEGDPVQMRQLFQNLLSNALKFHRHSVPPDISVWSDGAPADRRRAVSIHIRDNGTGIEARHMPEVFEPFKRCHGHGYPEGTGIGLAICRRIAENHGGAIDVQSEVGKGSEFIVTLGAETAEQKAQP